MACCCNIALSKCTSSSEPEIGALVVAASQLEKGLSSSERIDTVEESWRPEARSSVALRASRTSSESRLTKDRSGSPSRKEMTERGREGGTDRRVAAPPSALVRCAFVFLSASILFFCSYRFKNHKNFEPQY